MTTDAYCREIVHRLEGVFDQREAQAAARAILDDVLGYDTRYLLMYSDREMLPESIARVDRVVVKVLKGQPVQYATGRAHFMGRSFKVTPDVLIPRPETQGLVDMIIDEYSGRRDLRILDIGTGSGCIAISLARSLPFARVTACDISPLALDVARSNSRNPGTDIDFVLADILHPDALRGQEFDIIVSNPPYIATSEADDMDRRVTAYEPGDALFVPDSDPTIFYRAIAQYAADALTPGGGLFVEINPLFVRQTLTDIERCGLQRATVHRDYIGRKRFISAYKS